MPDAMIGVELGSTDRIGTDSTTNKASIVMDGIVMLTGPPTFCSVTAHLNPARTIFPVVKCANSIFTPRRTRPPSSYELGHGNGCLVDIRDDAASASQFETTIICMYSMHSDDWKRPSLRHRRSPHYVGDTHHRFSESTSHMHIIKCKL